MRSTFITLEQSYEYVGDNSRFQQRITWILAFQWIFYSLLVMGSPIMFRSPKFECKQSKNDSFKYCEEDTVCELLKKGRHDYYRVTSFNSISQEFELYCNKKYLIGIAQSALFVGQIFSGFLTSFLSDRVGRRTSLLFTIILGSLSVLSIGFAPDIYTVTALLFASGFGLYGYEGIILVYCTEISARRFRDISVNVLQIMWALGQFMIPLMNSISDYWRIIYTYCVGLPLICSVLLTYIYFCESPRYYASQGEYQRAREIFRHISEVNCRPPYQFHLMEEINDYNKLVTKVTNFRSPKNIKPQNEQQIEKFQRQQTTTLLDLFKTKNLAIITIIMCFYWFLRYFTYYCILFSMEKFGRQIKTNYLLLAMIEIFAGLISIPIKMRMKRKVALRYSFSIMIFVPLTFFLIRIPKECFIYYGFCFQEYLTILLVILLKFGIIFFTVNLLTYTSESFPTVLRSQGQGICMTIGQIGSVMAPIYISQYVQLFEQLNPLTIIAFLGIFGWLLSIKLCENEIMQDHIEDQEQGQLPLLKQFKEIQMTVFENEKN